MSAVKSASTSETGIDNETLDFDKERDEQTGSWVRANPRNAVIQPLSRFAFKVYLWGGDHVHLCVLGKLEGEYVGHCVSLVGESTEPCKGFLYGDGPCAHLCTLRKAEFVGRIGIEDAHQQDGDLVADGGRGEVKHVAGGQDGREFGTPEAQL